MRGNKVENLQPIRNNLLFQQKFHPPEGYSSDDSEDDICCTTHNESSQSCWSWQPQRDYDILLFFRESTVHGLKFIGTEGFSLLQRIIWLGVVLSALAGSIYLIEKGVFEPLSANPIIIAFQSQEITVDSIPFPAFTICNTNKIKRSEVVAAETKVNDYWDRYAKNKSNPGYIPHAEYEALQRMSHYCDGKKSFSRNFGYGERNAMSNQFEELHNSTESTHDTFYAENVRPIVMKAFHQCHDMLLLCIWERKQVNCSELFFPILAEFGFCCVFNMMPKFIGRNPDQHDKAVLEQEKLMNPEVVTKWEGWEIDRDLVITDPNSPKIQFPRHQKSAGVTTGLSILLNPELEEHYCAGLDGVGFKAVVHSPINAPLVVDFGKAIMPNSETFVAVHADVILPDDDVVKLTKEKRQCYFSNEYNLTAFKFYTQLNCEEECLANLTYKICGCVQYYMPRSPEQELCHLEKYACVDDLKNNVTKRGMKKTCPQCLPACTQIEYTAESSRLPLRDDVNLWKNDESENASAWIPDNLANKSVTLVHLFFATDTVGCKSRKALYGILDIIAKAGGLMELTLGISVISLVEPLYFFTIRYLGKYLKQSQEKKKANAEEERQIQMKMEKEIRNLNALRRRSSYDNSPKMPFKTDAFLIENSLANPGDFLRWSNAYSNDPKMQPKLIRFPLDFIKVHAKQF